MEKPFTTERTKFWRSQELNAADEETINCVEVYGFQAEHIGKDDNDGSKGFSYTCGLFDTTGMPEIIVVGLKGETAHYLLNEAGRRHQQGIDLTAQPQVEMIGDVTCIFRPVDQKWKEHLMRFNGWYHDHWDFPALQAIYPDLNGRFQWDADAEGKEAFQEYFRQPLLQADVEETIKEKDLWAENDPDSSLFDWKFPTPPHAQIYLSQAVQDGREPITYVAHEHDGDWQMLGDSMSEDKLPVISCFRHPIDKDPTLKELADLPRGWWAERVSPGEIWARRELDKES